MDNKNCEDILKLTVNISIKVLGLRYHVCKYIESHERSDDDILFKL
jgi:hypothetical protein